MATTLGNDISKWQGDVNFDQFSKNSQFVICKATEGTGYTDTKLTRNRDEARRTGMGLGFYHFARPDTGNTPESEADYFLNAIGGLRDGELLVLDYEPGTVGKPEVQAHVDWCKKWLDYVKSKTGVAALIYLNQSQVQKFNWKVVVDAGYGLWIAAYTYDPNKNTFQKGQWQFAAMQQWTNQQQVPGVAGNVDGNVFFGDLATFKKYGYKQSNAPTPPTPPPTTNPAITESSKYDFGGDIGVQEMQAIRSIINDLRRDNKSLKDAADQAGKFQDRINRIKAIAQEQ